MTITFQFQNADFDSLRKHLLPRNVVNEHAAFAFVDFNLKDDGVEFLCREWKPVTSAGFLRLSSEYLELTDEARSMMIKHAHDTGLCLVEFHSHTGPWPAAFSPTDLEGLREFVPHLWWRLKGRPYLAFVMARNGIDALAWIKSPTDPQKVDRILTGKKIIIPTQNTFRKATLYG